MTEQLKALAEATSNPTTHSVENFVAYIEAVTPERILALIAENARLTQANIDLTTILRLAARRKAEPDSGMEIMKL